MSQHLRNVLLAVAAGLLVLAGACDSGGGNDDPGLDVVETTDVGTPDTAETPDTTETPDVPVTPDVPEDVFVPTGEFKAGVAVGYLDGPVGTSMAGFGGRLGLVTPWAKMLGGTGGFYMAQHIKVMALDVDGERIFLVKTPLMSGESTVTYGIIRKVKELYDIDIEGRVLTSATHSHHATARYWRIPEALGLIGADEADDEVQERMFEDFAHVVKAAIDDLAPAEWGYTYVDDWDPDDDVYKDRRGENDPQFGKDPRLTLLALRRPDGTPMATIMNFGMHGTAHGNDNQLFTEDAPGAVELAFEDYFFAQEGAPILGMFVQAGGADAAPADGVYPRTGTATRLEALGLAAAPRIYEVYQEIEWRTEAELDVRSRFIDLRYEDMYADNDEFLGEGDVPYTWGGLQCCTDPYEGEGTWEGHPKDCLDIAWLLDLLQVEYPFEPLHQTYLTTARIGPLFLVTIPGESAYSIVQYTRDAIEERSTTEEPLDVLVYGYSQDHLLYFTSYEDWFYGGYETAGGLWGPLGGEYLIDRQMELVDAMLAGEAGETFYEESPRLSEEPYAFEPRPYEVSLTPATVLEDVPDTLEAPRGHTINFAWNGGDPGLRSPLVIVEAKQEDGSYERVASPSGRPGQALDNTRNYMVTRYDPDPAPTAAVLDERTHTWRVAWQVPFDFPGGEYRLLATGRYWDGSDVQDYEVASSDFSIVNAGELTVDATLADGTLSLAITVVPEAYEGTANYATAGWRVFDASIPNGQPIPFRKALSVTMIVNSEPEAGPYELVYDAEAGAYLFDYAGSDLPADPTSIELTWNLADDRTPLYKDAPVTIQ